MEESWAKLPFIRHTFGGSLRSVTAALQDRVSLMCKKKRQLSALDVIRRARGELRSLPTPRLLSACRGAWNVPITHCSGLLSGNTNKEHILSEGSGAAEMVPKNLRMRPSRGQIAALSRAVWHLENYLDSQRLGILIYKHANSINLVGLSWGWINWQVESNQHEGWHIVGTQDM